MFRERNASLGTPESRNGMPVGPGMAESLRA